MSSQPVHDDQFGKAARRVSALQVPHSPGETPIPNLVGDPILGVVRNIKRIGKIDLWHTKVAAPLPPESVEVATPAPSE